MNVVIFKLSPLGDTVMFLPVVQALHRAQPGWRITVVTSPTTADLYRATVPAVNLIITERAGLQRSWRRPWALFSWWWRIRRLRPDAVLLSFDQSSVARFLAATSGARVRVAGAGATIHLQAGLTHEVPLGTTASLAEWEWIMAQTMVEALGQKWLGQFGAPALPARARTTPRDGRPLVLIHAGASREYLRWLPEHFAALAARLAQNCDVVWVERPEITARAPAGVRTAAPHALSELLDLLAEADLFVGNHSGAFHLAAALGMPCVVPAGPTAFTCDPPWHRERHRILRAPLACLPCDQQTLAAEYCRNSAHPMACMHHWTVETIERVCRERLPCPG